MAWKRCSKGHKYVLTTCDVFYGHSILESGDSVADLCKRLPEFLVEEEDETIFLCQVGYWTSHKGEFWGPFDAEPHEMTTIFSVNAQNAHLLVEEEEEAEV